MRGFLTRKRPTFTSKVEVFCLPRPKRSKPMIRVRYIFAFLLVRACTPTAVACGRKIRGRGELTVFASLGYGGERYLHGRKRGRPSIFIFRSSQFSLRERAARDPPGTLEARPIRQAQGRPGFTRLRPTENMPQPGSYPLQKHPRKPARSQPGRGSSNRAIWRSQP